MRVLLQIQRLSTDGPVATNHRAGRAFGSHALSVQRHQGDVRVSEPEPFTHTSQRAFASAIR